MKTPSIFAIRIDDNVFGFTEASDSLMLDAARHGVDGKIEAIGCNGVGVCQRMGTDFTSRIKMKRMTRVENKGIIEYI